MSNPSLRFAPPVKHDRVVYLFALERRMRAQRQLERLRYVDEGLGGRSSRELRTVVMAAPTRTKSLESLVNDVMKR